MIPLTKGKYTATKAADDADMVEVYGLRGLCFGAAGGAADHFDSQATHVLIRTLNGEVVGSFRMSLLDGPQLGQSYAAVSYDMSALEGFAGPLLELGRFCIHPDHTDPDILRIAWAALTTFVDEAGVQMLFGCSSFSGTDPEVYREAFAILKARHLGPEALRPAVKADEVFRFDAMLRHKPDLAKGNAVMPPLLRTYLMMGGWVSDHAVVDRAMNTLHVFTALEIGAIPAARKKLLRALV